MTDKQYIESVQSAVQGAIDKSERALADGAFRFTTPTLFMNFRGNHDIATLVESRTNRKVRKTAMTLHSITFIIR